MDIIALTGFEDLAGCVDSFDFDIIPYPVPKIVLTLFNLIPALYLLYFQNNSTGASSNIGIWGQFNIIC